jgi:hypothetical protein
MPAPEREYAVDHVTGTAKNPQWERRAGPRPEPHHPAGCRRPISSVVVVHGRSGLLMVLAGQRPVDSWPECSVGSVTLSPSVEETPTKPASLTSIGQPAIEGSERRGQEAVVLFLRGPGWVTACASDRSNPPTARGLRCLRVGLSLDRRLYAPRPGHSPRGADSTVEMGPQRQPEVSPLQIAGAREGPRADTSPAAGRSDRAVLRRCPLCRPILSPMPGRYTDEVEHASPCLAPLGTRQGRQDTRPRDRSEYGAHSPRPSRHCEYLPHAARSALAGSGHHGRMVTPQAR